MEIIAGALLSIINKLIRDPDQRAKLIAELQTAEIQKELSIAVAQAHCNAAEAEHEGIFIAGWRPCLAWSCTFIFLWNFLLIPVLTCVLGLLHGHIVAPPFDLNFLMTLLGGLLGLSGLRTFEKYNGIHTSRISPDDKDVDDGKI